jgi:hypothetical protein
VQRTLARELVEFDADYRDVLSTVASLSASLDSRRVQRVATGISVGSLIVAAVTLWVTSDQAELIRSAEALLGTLIWW